jgi:peptidoglycan/xylan/chitin deacetylase (PgdA/CDA1 family)
MRNVIFLFGISILFASCATNKGENPGHTVITKWQGDKKSAISITYDDGSINQFKVAIPIMNKLGMPGTFFINTTKVNGSAKGKFIGRPQEMIIKETASIKTNQDNFFERASLIRFTGINKAVDYHTRAGSLFESGKIKEAYALIDSAYEQVRSKGLKNNPVIPEYAEEPTTWEDFKTFTAEGHEIASHTITHPKLAVLDEVNMLYELEQCKADIEKFLGKKYAFSCECPYGTENERVMEYALKIYPALRSRMPEPYLDELNRASKKQPGESKKEYVQWQRGLVRKISMAEMKSYVDTCIVHNNIWLVLVIHGIDGIGWEPRTGAEIQEYFSYIKEKDPYVWVATFGDVTRYMRERKNSTVTGIVQGEVIKVNISSTLDHEMYDIPMTLKTYVPKSWKVAVLDTNANLPKLQVQKDDMGYFVLYSVKPGEGEITLTKQTPR